MGLLVVDVLGAGVLGYSDSLLVIGLTGWGRARLLASASATYEARKSTAASVVTSFRDEGVMVASKFFDYYRRVSEICDRSIVLFVEALPPNKGKPGAFA